MFIYRNAMLLGLCQFLLMASAAVGISFNGLVGERLAASTALATLPFLTMTATTAALTLLLPRYFARMGYQNGFVLGALLGILGSLMAAYGVWQSSFVIFCGAGFFMGCYQATALYYRFAAADSVPDAPQKSSAIGWVLNGGIIAAVLGPLLAGYSLHWFSVDYLGSYMAVALIAALAIPVFFIMTLPGRQFSPLAPVSLALVLAQPKARAAMLFCAGGYAMMMLVMLASPLAMHSCGFGARDAASVIQWHLLGMFAPSLVTGKLIARFGVMPIAFVGCAILVVGCVVALMGIALTHFHWALMLVGVGWNFMYIGGSTLITQVSDLSLRARLQSINEFTTFACMTLTAGVTGLLYQQLGWQPLLWLAIIFVSLVVLLVIVEARVRPKTECSAGA
jgi:MFS family permease